MANNQEDKVSMTNEEIRLRCLDLAQVHFKKPYEVIQAAEQYAEYVKKGPTAIRGVDKPNVVMPPVRKDAEKNSAEASILS